MRAAQRIQDFFPALDTVGATASLMCAIHCLAMPVLLVVLPTLGLGFLLNESLERGFVIGSVVLAVANTCWGFEFTANPEWSGLLPSVVFFCFAQPLVILIRRNQLTCITTMLVTNTASTKSSPLSLHGVDWLFYWAERPLSLRLIC